MDLKDFFSAAEARSDRWSEMNTVGRAWEAATAYQGPKDSQHDYRFIINYDFPLL